MSQDIKYIQDLILEMAFITEEDKPTQEQKIRLTAIRTEVKENFTEYFQALVGRDLLEIESFTETDFANYEMIDVSPAANAPVIPTHATSKEMLEELDKHTARAYSTVSGALAEVNGVMVSWANKLERAERIFKALSGIQVAHKAKSIFETTLSQKLTSRMDQMQYYQEKLNQKLKGLEATKQLLNQMVNLYLSDNKNENQTTRTVKTDMKNHEVSRFPRRPRA